MIDRSIAVNQNQLHPGVKGFFHFEWSQVSRMELVALNHATCR